MPWKRLYEERETLLAGALSFPTAAAVPDELRKASSFGRAERQRSDPERAERQWSDRERAERQWTDPEQAERQWSEHERTESEEEVDVVQDAQENAYYNF